MELRGGRLAKDMPAEVQAPVDQAGKGSAATLPLCAITQK